MTYSLFSRQQGYLKGPKVRYYQVGKFDITEKCLIGKTGKEIIDKVDNSKIKSLCKEFPQWYLYPSDTIIKAMYVD